MKAELVPHLKRYFDIMVKRPIEHPQVLYPKAAGQPIEIPRGDYQKVVLELGTGWGEVALNRAQAHPEWLTIGLEVKKDRVGSILKRQDKAKVKNLFLAPANITWFYDHLFAENSFDEICVYFPDPWPKRRHRKHRFVNRDFLIHSAKFLKPGGRLQFASDFKPYARQVLGQLLKLSEIYMPDESFSENRALTLSRLGINHSMQPIVGSFFEGLAQKDNLPPQYICFRKKDGV